MMVLQKDLELPEDLRSGLLEVLCTTQVLVCTGDKKGLPFLVEGGVQ